MAKYRCLTDIFLPAPGCRYAQAGDLLSDVIPTPANCIPIPVGWIPPLGVEPIDAAAQSAFFNAGPSGMNNADHGIPNTMMSGQRWSGIAVAPPNVYWKPTVVNNVHGWTLGGTTFWPG
jgi:hypothetical protein